MLPATIKSKKSKKVPCAEQKLKKYRNWEVSGRSKNAVKRGKMEDYSEIEKDLIKVRLGHFH